MYHPAVKPLLLEIGTEELPPSLIAPAATELERQFRALLTEHDIAASESEVFYTPRRIAVRFAAVATERPARTVEVQGPPTKVAFGSDGRPTKTAIGFARSQGCTEKDLFTRPTPKGEYVFACRKEPALPTIALLADRLPAIVTGLPFARTMRWREGKTRFSRPIRWLVCLFGTEVVRFELAGVATGNMTYGHRGTTGPVCIPAATDYEQILAEQFVLCRPLARRKAVIDSIEKLCEESGGRPVLDPELVEETVNITEYPVPILCRFDPAYLELPAEVLITALKKHQRCFAVRGADEKLLPLFVAVADTPGCNQTLVGRWYEHAVESRLRDARFYFEQDLAKGLEALVEEEKRVTWIEEIGTYFDKTQHLRAICRHLAQTVRAADPAALDRAALLAKADLLTSMVREKEFTSLQGRMGGIYARLAGEPALVADAIAEQYRPVSTDDALPATIEGALLGIADRIVNIVGTFAIGEIPTGSEDPFALRRQAAGLLAIILRHNLEINLNQLISTTVGLFPTARPELSAKLEAFFQERLEAMLGDKDVPYDIADAVLGVAMEHPTRALAAATALIEFRRRPEFERLIIGQKRVANILKDQQVSGQPDPAIFAEEAEIQLWNQARIIEPQVTRAMAQFDFVLALELLLKLREPIDRLFDEVMVMAEDEKLRTNRLRLMLYIRSLFHKVADLSRIVLEGDAR